MTNEQKLREALEKIRALATPPDKPNMAATLDGIHDMADEAPQPPTSDEPDKYCVTQADGECVSTDPRCMHQSDEGTPLCDSMSVLARPMTEGEPIQEMLRFRDAQTLERTLHAKERELADERAIVDRIWNQLGRPSYDELNGRSIHDLIDELKRQLAAIPSVSAAPQEGKADNYNAGVVAGLRMAAEQDWKYSKEIEGLGGIAAHLRAERAASAVNHEEAIEQLIPPPPATPRGDGGESIPLEISEWEPVFIPRFLAANFLRSTEVPRFKRILESALATRPTATVPDSMHSTRPENAATNVNAAPQSGKKEEWISVSERLPDDAEIVLVSSGRATSLASFHCFDSGSRFEFEWFKLEGPVIEWRPLPAPSPSASKAEGE